MAGFFSNIVDGIFGTSKDNKTRQTQKEIEVAQRMNDLECIMSKVEGRETNPTSDYSTSFDISNPIQIPTKQSVSENTGNVSLISKNEDDAFKMDGDSFVIDTGAPPVPVSTGSSEYVTDGDVIEGGRVVKKSECKSVPQGQGVIIFD